MTILSAVMGLQTQVSLFVIVTVVESLFATYACLRHQAIFASPSIPQLELIDGAIFQSGKRNIQIVGKGNVNVSSKWYRRKAIFLRLLPHLIFSGLIVICALLLSVEAGVYVFDWHGKAININNN